MNTFSSFVSRIVPILRVMVRPVGLEYGNERRKGDLMIVKTEKAEALFWNLKQNLD